MKSKFGADIKMIGLPFVGQYEKLVVGADGSLRRLRPLGLPPVFPRGLRGPRVPAATLEPYFSLLDPQIGDDYIPVYKDPVIKRDGKTYALMYDGDMLQVAYRKDLFDDPTEQKNFKAKYGWDLAPAANWDQFMQISEFFTRPPNLYGTAFYAARGFCYAWFINIFAGLGGRWFSDDMKPGINSDAGVKALETLVKMKDYAVPNILQIDYPALNEVFLNGSTAMVIQWNDLALKVGEPADEQGGRQGRICRLPGAHLPPLQPRHGGVGFRQESGGRLSGRRLHAASRRDDHLRLRLRTAVRTPTGGRR